MLQLTGINVNYSSSRELKAATKHLMVTRVLTKCFKFLLLRKKDNSKTHKNNNNNFCIKTCKCKCKVVKHFF